MVLSAPSVVIEAVESPVVVVVGVVVVGVVAGKMTTSVATLVTKESKLPNGFGEIKAFAKTEWFPIVVPEVFHLYERVALPSLL